jgi:hypothetical protein
MASDDEDDAAPPAENSGETAKPRGRPFPPGQSGNPGGRPATSKEFRELARNYSAGALRKLYAIALGGTGSAAVRACELIIERAWGRPPLEVSGPRGGPIDMRFHGAVRSAIEQLIAEEAESQAAGDDDPKN